ncbi:hypothetical protein, partial [Pseudomonas sp.]|uniref:hypothetical protein n=1 Tax=Pseudomonas sp. TaxID=306 RepID=UPI0032677838
RGLKIPVSAVRFRLWAPNTENPESQDSGFFYVWDLMGTVPGTIEAPEKASIPHLLSPRQQAPVKLSRAESRQSLGSAGRLRML